MDPDLSRRRAEDQLAWDNAVGTTVPSLDDSAMLQARPLFRPAPRSAMVFPLVVLVAVLPGLVALNTWDLTPPGPFWGLRGLAVLDGLVLDQTSAALEIEPLREATAFEAVAYQPPLYAWLVALGFWLSPDRNPQASVLPSYLFGAIAVVLVYLHGRLWRGSGLGVTAAILVGFNQNLLLRMQEGTPATVALCAILSVLAVYSWREQLVSTLARPWPWASPTVWAILGGLALGSALLALGTLALLVIPIVLLHQYYLQAAGALASERSLRNLWWPDWRRCTGRLHGLLALGVALIVFAPWLFMMFRLHGWRAWSALEIPPEGLLADRHLSLLPRLIELAPAVLPLAALGTVRAIRSALVDEANSREAVGGSLWVIWLGVAALAPVVWPGAPQGDLELVLLVPVSLLAAQTVVDLVNRRVSLRALIWLAPATTLTVAWWASIDLHNAIDDLLHRRATAATALGLHLVADLVVASVWALRALYRWARRRDARQRFILATFLLVVMAVTIGEGLREVMFRHDATHVLLSLRTVILRRNRDSPFQLVAVVSPQSSLSVRASAQTVADRSLPGGRLRFILKTALPQVPQRHLKTIDELFQLPDGHRLIILAGAEQHLSSAEQLKLGLEAIHPGRSGILDAYATTQKRVTRR
jgi:4-amino-4-deoxy-L-arabinose transferase-like glycosyltransferase